MNVRLESAISAVVHSLLPMSSVWDGVSSRAVAVRVRLSWDTDQLDAAEDPIQDTRCVLLLFVRPMNYVSVYALTVLRGGSRDPQKLCGSFRFLGSHDSGWREMPASTWNDLPASAHASIETVEVFRATVDRETRQVTSLTPVNPFEPACP